MEEINGILISCSIYKDYDGVLNILTKTGYQTVLAKNIFKDDNKNHGLLNGFVIANFECYKGKVGGLKLRSYSLKKNVSLDYFDYDSIIILDSLKEILIKTKENDDYLSLYNELENFLMNSTKDNRLNQFLNFIYMYLIILGIKPLIEGKFNCLNYEFGKFDYTFDENLSFNDTKIDIIQSLEDGTSCIYIKEDVKELIMILIRFIEYRFSIRFNCIDLLKTL